MTYEELKAKLEQLRHAKRRLKQQEKLIAEEREMMDGLTSFQFDNVAVKGGQKTPVQEKYVEHMERLIGAYEAIMEEVFALEDFLADNMGALSPLEQSMITERYINGTSWKKIQEEFHYEERQPYEIVKKAMEKMLKSPQ